MGTGFLDCESLEVLQELASHPIDLTLPETLSQERIQRYALSAEGFTYSYATERVDERSLCALNGLAEERELVKQMERMQQGAVMNYIEGVQSESRAVLHTATRAWVRDHNLQGEAASIADYSEQEAHRLAEFLYTARSRFSTLVQIGIGGSELGPKAMYFAMQGCCPSDKQIFFVSNVDPDNAAEVLQKIDLEQTLVVVVSKSGTTLEPAVNEELFRRAYQDKGLATVEHFVAVTAQGSPMDDHSRYLEVFHLWDSIGGRFSSTSMVGGVVIGFAFGFEAFLEFLQGAASMDVHALTPVMEKNLPLLSAMIGIWNRNLLGYPTTAVIPYATGLKYFPAHLQQCGMESNGKSISIQGKELLFKTTPIIWGDVGTNCQHSFFQSLHQGTDVVPVEFIGFLQNQRGLDCMLSGSSSSQKLFANLIAQSLALAQGRDNANPNKKFRGNRPSSILVAQQLSPRIAGGLLAYYEHKFAFQGFCWGINSFDQEGVSLGKELATQIMGIMSGTAPLEFPEAREMLRIFNAL